MSTMSVLDLQCQEAQELFTLFLDSNDDVPVGTALDVLKQITYTLTPIEAWELTLPYMTMWAWEEFGFRVPVECLH